MQFHANFVFLHGPESQNYFQKTEKIYELGCVDLKSPLPCQRLNLGVSWESKIHSSLKIKEKGFLVHLSETLRNVLCEKKDLSQNACVSPKEAIVSRVVCVA